MNLLIIDSPIGHLGLWEEEDGFLTRLSLPNQPLPRIATRETPLLSLAKVQLEEYFAGTRKTFSIPLAPKGTLFQKKVWAALQEIPCGQVRTYKDIAIAVDSPKGFRAVGMANHNNPIPIIIPCHRVVNVGGGLGGYASGIETKKQLLSLEECALPL